jgi:hypothetical protein
MFPINSQTISKTIFTSERILPNGNYYIYSTHLVSTDVSNIALFCNENLISFTKQINRTDEAQMNYHCQGTITGENLGTGSGFALITYSTSTTSTIPAIYNGFTYGEMIITMFLFMIFLVIIFQFFVIKFLGIKIHKEV